MREYLDESSFIGKAVKTFNQDLQDLGRIYSGTAAGAFIGNLLAMIPEALLVNWVGAAIGTAFVSGAEAQVRSLFSGSAQSALTLETMTTILGSSTSAALAASKFGGFALNVLAQGALDTLLTDQDKIYALFDGATEEEQAEFGWYG